MNPPYAGLVKLKSVELWPTDSPASRRSPLTFKVSLSGLVHELTTDSVARSLARETERGGISGVFGAAVYAREHMWWGTISSRGHRRHGWLVAVGAAAAESVRWVKHGKNWTAYVPCQEGGGHETPSYLADPGTGAPISRGIERQHCA